MTRGEEYSHYWDKGWVVAEGVFEPEEADRAAAELLDIAGRERDTAKAGYLIDHSADGARSAPRKIDTPFLKSEVCRRLVSGARLRDRIRNLLGVEPLLCMDQAFLKPPRFGSAKPYHQDNFYFRCHPDDEVITAWIALDDVDISNGCLRYIDGSHRGPILEHFEAPGEDYNLTPPPERIDLARESLAPVRKGGVVFHHSKTLHASHRNESGRWRKAYATHWVTARVTCEIETLDEAYFKRPEYALLFA